MLAITLPKSVTLGARPCSARKPARARPIGVRAMAPVDPRDDHDGSSILSGEWEPTLTW
jgi:hypothetical protein